jgi:hypothetical protein
VAAKLATAALYALSSAVLIFGSQLLILALTFGPDGASAPTSSLSGWVDGLAGETLGEIFLRIGIVSLVSTVAVAAVIALASSFTRHPLFSLLSGSALVAMQFLPMILASYRYPWGLNFMDVPFWYHAFNLAMLLPTIALLRMDALSYVLREPYGFAMGLVLSSLVAAVSGVLAYRHFLRMRRD